MSQLNFFFSNEEIREKIEAIMASREVEVFNGLFHDTSSPKLIGSIKELAEFDKLVLWLKNDIKEPKCSCEGRGNMEGKHLFDGLRDPIIEIDNVKDSGNLVSPGRIFYKTGWIENEDLRRRHKSWANKIYKLFDKDTIKVNKTWRVLKLSRNGWMKEAK
jgi:hypothetical protein